MTQTDIMLPHKYNNLLQEDLKGLDKISYFKEFMLLSKKKWL